MEKRTAKQYFKELFQMFLVFLKIGFFSFGGGYAMLALIEGEVVDKKHWLTHSEMSEIFAIAESTPGPIAINTATFIGAKRLGVFGGIFATLGVVIPSFAIIVALSYILELVKDNKWVGFLFRGIRVGVLVLIARAVLSFFKNMRKTVFSFALCAIAFLLVFLVKVDVIYVILGTIVLCSIIVAWESYYRNHRLHMLGTAEYYSERLGKPLEVDEYVGEKSVQKGIVKIRKGKDAETASEEGGV
ncbi:MAG: chromate transporter [Clostridia bacterium]|nr:chromate transporter [Clostridia bacterium]